MAAFKCVVGHDGKSHVVSARSVRITREGAYVFVQAGFRANVFFGVIVVQALAQRTING